MYSALTFAALAVGVLAHPQPHKPEWSWKTTSTNGVTWSTPIWHYPTPTQGQGWPWPHPTNWPPTPCMNSEQASTVANNFRDTIASPFSTPLVEAAFAPTFHDYSDSVIELIDGGCGSPIPLGSATFNSSTNFADGQSGQAPIPFEILNLWNTCNSVHMRWMSSNTGGPVTPPQQVTGIIAIEVVQNTNQAAAAANPWLIETVYSEFNSGAWLYNLGIFKPTCPAPPPPKM